MQRLSLAILLLAAGCGAATATTARAGEDADDEEAEDLPDLPQLQRLGDLAPGEYLFTRAALGSGSAPLVRARLISVEPDAFVVSVDGGPHRRVARSEAWPMACLRSEIEHVEGELAMRLAAGAPVFVLASSEDAARVSVVLATERSRVVRRSVIALEDCTTETPSGGASGVAATEVGDVVCLFADQESLDPSAGLPVPAGAPLRVLEEDGEWARVEVAAPGGTVSGWMGADRIADAGTPDWIGAALASAQCVFPGRADARANTEMGREDAGAPAIPQSEIERIVRNNTSQIQACYEARLSDVPDLRVTLDVVMLVDADGHVESARITRGASADEGLARCVIERLRRWRFPAPRIGSVEVRRTFELRPPR